MRLIQINCLSQPFRCLDFRCQAERVKAVLEAYDEWTKLLPDGDMDHPARVYLIDPKGQIRDIYSLAFFNEKQVFIDILTLLK